MKNMLALIILMSSGLALAHPGGHTLTCKSAANSDHKQPVEISMHRSNDIGWFAPSIEVKIKGQPKYKLDTPDEMVSYGGTFHNSPLGVIHITAENLDDNTATTWGSFSIVGIPSSVRAFDDQGHPVKWSFKKNQNECYDSNGKALFKGLLRGYLNHKGEAIQLDTQVLDCKLEYNSGRAC